VGDRCQAASGWAAWAWGCRRRAAPGRGRAGLRRPGRAGAGGRDVGRRGPPHGRPSGRAGGRADRPVLGGSRGRCDRCEKRRAGAGYPMDVPPVDRRSGHRSGARLRPRGRTVLPEFPRLRLPPCQAAGGAGVFVFDDSVEGVCEGCLPGPVAKSAGETDLRRSWRVGTCLCLCCASAGSALCGSVLCKLSSCPWAPPWPGRATPLKLLRSHDLTLPRSVGSMLPLRAGRAAAAPWPRSRGR